MLLTLSLLPELLAASPDTLLGYTIDQPISSLNLPTVARGAFTTTANVAGESGALFLVPCGDKIHEIIFQVIVFPASANDGTHADPSMRFAADPLTAGLALRQWFSVALQTAGWVVRVAPPPAGAVSMANYSDGTTFTRDGLTRSVWVECEPFYSAAAAKGQSCRVSLHAGGVSVCTAGL